jgi:L-alanine-DL-glutamate epimerase-like enolase superfamily enzyme
MVRAIRFMSRPEVSFRAISAVDMALWDLKARLLGLPLCDLLGPVRERVQVYGSSDSRWSSAGALAEQLGTWAAEGMASVKIRVIGEPWGDRERVRVAREAIGDDVDLFVDAAGTHRTPRAALAQAQAYAQHGVACLEQPLATDDVDGLAQVREGAPAGMAIAARSDRLEDLRHLVDAGAVDVVQVDATRCLGVTGFLAAGELCRTHDRPLSARRAPAAHVHLACAVGAVVSLEWFQEHARVERLLFDGAVEPYDGIVRPDFDRPGLGLDPRPDALAHWQV